MLQDVLSMDGEIKVLHLLTQAIVEEALGEMYEEVALHGRDGLLDIETVAQESVKNRLAKRAIVSGLGRHVEGPGSEILATGASCLILGIGDVQPGDLAVSRGAEAAL